MRGAHAIEPRRRSSASAVGKNRLVAQVQGRAVSLPDQRVEREPQVRPRAEPFGPDGFLGPEPAGEVAARLIRKRLVRMCHVPGHHPQADRQQAEQDHPRRSIAPPRPSQSRQQHRRAQARHQNDGRGDVLHGPGAAAVGIAPEARGDQSERERGQQQREDRLRTAPPIGRHRRRDEAGRQRAPPHVPAGGIGEHLARMRPRQPEEQRPGRSRRERAGPVDAHPFHDMSALRRVDRAEQDQEGRDGRRPEKRERHERPRGSRLEDGDRQDQSHARRDEDRRVRDRDRQRPKRDEAPQKDDSIGRCQPLHRQGEQPQGDEEIGRVRLDFAAVSDRRVADRQDRHGDHQRLPVEQPAREVAEQEQPGERRDRGQKPQRPLAEPERPADGLLRPKEEQRADLLIIERPRQPREIALQKVRGQERLVPPERMLEPEPKQPQRDPQRHKNAQPCLHSLIGPSRRAARRRAGESQVGRLGRGVRDGDSLRPARFNDLKRSGTV